jgi:hypothetical protein
MARRSNEPTSTPDKAKVRVFFAEVEGNNESIQEALKRMASAMSRPVLLVSEPTADGNVTLPLQQPNPDKTEDAIEEIEEGGKLDDEARYPSARRGRGTGKKVDRNAGITLVANLEFRPSGKQSLKEFWEEKNPKTDLEATLTAVYYMQHVMDLSEIGPGHVMTAFREAGKAIPVDIRQTIRNVKRNKIWLNFDSNLDGIRTTTQGENYILYDMGGGDNR